MWIPPTAVRAARSGRGRGGTHRRHALLARRTLPPTVGQRWSTVSGQRALQALPLTPIPTPIRADCLAPRRRLDHARVARWGDDGRVRRLTTRPGIGSVLALLVVLELADISRCPSATHLASATGLTPRVRASAGSVRVGPISQEGHRLLRWALVLAATQAARRKGQQIARVALAWRLAAICAQVWQAAMDCLAVRRRGGVRGGA